MATSKELVRAKPRPSILSCCCKTAQTSPPHREWPNCRKKHAPCLSPQGSSSGLSPENGSPTRMLPEAPPPCTASSLPAVLSPPLKPQSSTSQTGVTRTVSSASLENLLESRITLDLQNPKLWMKTWEPKSSQKFHGILVWITSVLERYTIFPFILPSNHTTFKLNCC